MSSRSKGGLAVALLLASVALTGCAVAHYVTSDPVAGGTAVRPATSITRHVVVISIDGLRPDAIARFRAETLSRMMREGSSTLSATTVVPSKTLPSHISMLTGQPPSVHGVIWNSDRTSRRGTVQLPTVFAVVRPYGYTTAAFFSKPKFRHLQRPGSVDYSQAPANLFSRWSDGRTVSDVRKYLATARPNLLFVHLAGPDDEGHRSGWMSPEYGKSVRRADKAVAQILEAADASFGHGRYTLVVTADHGGHGYDHGSADPRDVTIPWIAWGDGVAPGLLPPASIRIFDTASTVLWLLGVSQPSDWSGAAVTAAFRSRD
jgi:predicted AlkP superfamily pyrophosphatase or phosphodiesterase